MISGVNGIPSRSGCLGLPERACAGVVGSDVGLIGLDSSGGIGIGHATPAMFHAWYTDGMDAPKVRMRVP